MSNPTKNEKEANEFDLHLFRLMMRADIADVRWAEIALDLAGIRNKVRKMMTAEDRETTR